MTTASGKDQARREQVGEERMIEKTEKTEKTEETSRFASVTRKTKETDITIEEKYPLFPSGIG
jgi:hypothetical protein